MRNVLDRITGRNRHSLSPSRRRFRVQPEPLELREMLTGGLNFQFLPDSGSITSYYELTGGNLYDVSYVTGESTLIDSGVESFKVGNLGGSSDLLFERTMTGDLKMYDGTGFTTLDSGVKSFDLGQWAGNDYLVDLTSAGDLKTNDGTGWTTQDTHVQSFAIGPWAGDNYLMDLNSDCQLKTSTGSGWTVQDSQVKSFALGPLAGENWLFDLKFNGTLNGSTGNGWNLEDTGVQQFALGRWAGQDTLADLSYGAAWGALKTSFGYGWTTQDTNIGSFALGEWAGDDYLVERTLGGVLNTSTGSGWVTQDTGVQSFALGSWAGDAYLIELTGAGDLNTSVGTGWTTQDTGVQSFALGTWAGSDQLIDLESSGTLLSSIGYGWNVQDSGIEKVALGDWAGFDQLVELTSAHIINASDGNGWTTIGHGIQAFDQYTTGQFQRIFSDIGVRNVVSTDFVRDDAITYEDMLDVFNQVLASGPENAAEAQDLQTLVTYGVYTYNMPDYVKNLTNKVVNPSANDVNNVSSYFGRNVFNRDNLALYGLVHEWFLGDVHPSLKSGDSTNSFPYSTVSGTLFGPNGPSFADVQQGQLGDCTYMASLAEVAARAPGYIQNMFIDHGNGVYTVRFFHNGAPDYVTVDSQLPGGGGRYDGPVNNVLWAALAEKAFAQVNIEGWLPTINPIKLPWGPTVNFSYAGVDSYDVLNNGNSGTVIGALQALTGLGTSSFSVNPTNLGTAYNQGKLIVLGTNNTSNVSDSRIEHNHAYAMVGYAPLPFGLTLYTLFNPWGTGGGYEAVTNVFKPGIVNVTGSILNSDFNYQAVAGAARADVTPAAKTEVLGAVMTPEAPKHDIVAVAIDAVRGPKRSQRIAHAVVDRMYE